jgi:hypothetical protein
MSEPIEEILDYESTHRQGEPQSPKSDLVDTFQLFKSYNYLKICCFSSIPNGRLTLIFILIGRIVSVLNKRVNMGSKSNVMVLAGIQGGSQVSILNFHILVQCKYVVSFKLCGSAVRACKYSS